MIDELESWQDYSQYIDDEDELKLYTLEQELSDLLGENNKLRFLIQRIKDRNALQDS